MQEKMKWVKKLEPFLTIVKIAAFWGIINLGYYFILPKFGLSLSYNTSPVFIAVYYSLAAIFGAWYFRVILNKWVTASWWMLLYFVLSLASAALLFGLLYLFSLLPNLKGPNLAPYTDLVFATPWYFLPKAVEILVQQLLITLVIIELFYKYNSLRKVIIGYIICFGGAHIILFLVNGAPAPYAIFITASAFLTSFIFPWLTIRVRSGFVYAYSIHFAFYILLAMLLHAFPPPGYFA